MGLFNLFKSSNSAQFVSEKQFEENLQNQLRMAPQTLQQLKEYKVTEDTQLKLEFFFYTNANDKASQLTEALKALGYDVDFGEAARDKKLLIVTGWTVKIKMDELTVLKWTEDMTRLGYKYDAEFDGWGTNPQQE